MQKPSIPKGTRDFSPEEMANRNYIFNTIKSVFQLFGFRQIETPAMENLSTLMGKYGEEGDKLLFKILNSGDYLSDFDEGQRERIELITSLKKTFISKVITGKKKESVLDKLHLTDETVPEMKIFSEILVQTLLLEEIVIKQTDGTYILGNEISINELKPEVTKIAERTLQELLKKEIAEKVGKEKGLRYDLTVPFARYVVQHRDQITFPFKRYQIQPVWRADRPQKGRYREFYQCDADVVGSDSLVNEVDLIQIIDDVFTRFQLPVVIKINNRKILSGVAEIIGAPDKMIDIAIAIDKYDKIGEDGVIAELESKGFNNEQIVQLRDVFLMHSNKIVYDIIPNVDNQLQFLKNGSDFRNSSILQKGVDELEYVLAQTKEIGLKTAEVKFDITLARGLNYYTGAIFEVAAKNVQMGSISGGGRYDNLTGVFGMEGVSGVGISFGADRIYDVLLQLNAFPASSEENTRLLFLNFGEKEQRFCLPLLKTVREAGINAEIFPEPAKIKKQMSYADAKGIPYVAIVGENELNANSVMLKNMQSGEQELVLVTGLIAKLV